MTELWPNGTGTGAPRDGRRRLRRRPTWGRAARSGPVILRPWFLGSGGVRYVGARGVGPAHAPAAVPTDSPMSVWTHRRRAPLSPRDRYTSCLCMCVCVCRATTVWRIPLRRLPHARRTAEIRPEGPICFYGWARNFGDFWKNATIVT